ncbi:hypothetical protein CGJ49_24460 [Vibrio parahaemolyticus]|nr:hypothetical protein CXR47_25565 [Vibrio parahaemolyticus]TOE02700.1 hypothetical protein CGJ51_24530 [Vibrio parahaemolyticus]TOE05094.1 hypothetical protein CGJ52_13120 [Vibrio parahaemolyticus]TOE14141.1 hypothetical protein CGJ49_24460 [Vibrio parahaemolyticus]
MYTRINLKSNAHNKAFKSDSQRLAFSLRSSIAKRCSHLNAALGFAEEFSETFNSVYLWSINSRFWILFICPSDTFRSH